MKKYDARELLHKYRNGTCTEEEKAIVESWLISQLSKTGMDVSEEELKQIGNRIWEQLPVQKHRTPWLRYAAAASIILAISITAITLLRSKKTSAPVAQKTSSTVPVNDALPGGNKAVLTLANGAHIVLDTARNGLLATEQQSAIHKADGAISYEEATRQTANAGTQYNMLTVPVGGQYRITLPDGTQVWMNAVSTLRFPLAFTGAERTVELTGEAYFEVAKNKNMPFKVITPQQEVIVLGTHFNINAYHDEPDVRTTLLEGFVQVKNASGTMTIKPGQQTVINRTTGAMKVQTADTEHALAWKNGYFQFNNEKLDIIMRRIARWYDVEITYQPGYTQDGFIGTISRYENVSRVLKVLKLTEKVNFRLEGKKLTVMP